MKKFRTNFVPGQDVIKLKQTLSCRMLKLAGGNELDYNWHTLRLHNVVLFN